MDVIRCQSSLKKTKAKQVHKLKYVQTDKIIFVFQQNIIKYPHLYVYRGNYEVIYEL